VPAWAVAEGNSQAWPLAASHSSGGRGQLLRSMKDARQMAKMEHGLAVAVGQSLLQLHMALSVLVPVLVLASCQV